ncbi:MAG: type II toxin-antitoxin system death-on-curing family toxin [Flavobacteriales bacterium]
MISLEEALAIHTALIDVTGGAHGLRDRGGLEAALARPKATFEGTLLYPRPEDQAAALLESVVKNHPFVDGNKRAGYVLARLLLMTHDLDIHATDNEEFDLIIQVATGTLDVQDITEWIESHIIPLN